MFTRTIVLFSVFSIVAGCQGRVDPGLSFFGPNQCSAAIKWVKAPVKTARNGRVINLYWADATEETVNEEGVEVLLISMYASMDAEDKDQHDLAFYKSIYQSTHYHYLHEIGRAFSQCFGEDVVVELDSMGEPMKLEKSFEAYGRQVSVRWRPSDCDDEGFDTDTCLTLSWHLN